MNYQKRTKKFVRVLSDGRIFRVENENYNAEQLIIIDENNYLSSINTKYTQQVYPDFKIGDHVLGDGDVFKVNSGGDNYKDLGYIVFGEQWINRKNVGKWVISVFKQDGWCHGFSNDELEDATLISSPCKQCKCNKKEEKTMEEVARDIINNSSLMKKKPECSCSEHVPCKKHAKEMMDFIVPVDDHATVIHLDEQASISKIKSPCRSHATACCNAKTKLVGDGGMYTVEVCSACDNIIDE